MITGRKYSLLSVSFYTLIFLTSLLLIFIHRIDIKQQSAWLIFFWWLTIFLSGLFSICFTIPAELYRKIWAVLKREAGILILILGLASLTRFIFLVDYPYVTIGDELRDAGFNGLKLKLGDTKDVFDFGSYQGYGNFIPLISYFFLKLLGLNPLIYRLPAALLGIGSIVLTYLIGYIAGGRKIGLTASLFLIGSVLHLHYSRTELLVIADSFLAAAVFLAIYFAFLHQEGFFLTGLLSGLSLHFYAGIRGVVLISIIYLFAAHVFRSAWRKTLIGFIIFIIGFTAAAGPTVNLIQNQLRLRVGTANFILNNPVFQKKSFAEKIDHLSRLYERSFLVYAFEPVNDFHFPYYQRRQRESLLPSPLNWFFLVGLFALIFTASRKSVFAQLMLANIFIFPLINQVVIGNVGADHRLMSIVPVLAIVAALGLIKLADLIPNKKWRGIGLTIVIVFYLVSQFYVSFIKRASDAGFVKKEYLFQEMLAFIRKDTVYQEYYIASNDADNFEPLHYYEKMVFFTHPKKVFIVSQKELAAKIGEKYRDPRMRAAFLVIQPDQTLENYPQEKFVKICSAKKWPNYSCPPDSQGNLEFYLF